MRKSSDNGNSLLTARLNGKPVGHGKAPAEPDVGILRRKRAESAAEVPVYGSTDTAKGSPSKKLKQEKVSPSSTPKSRPLDHLSAKKAEKESPKWDTPYERQALDDMPDSDTFDSELERESLDEARRRERVKHTKSRLIKLVTIVTILLCGYMAFLIYGVVQTNYVYDGNGNVTPEILSVESRKILNEYEVLSQYYLQARILYEQALKLDYRLAEEPDNTLAIAMEYSGMLDSVAKLSVDIDAANFSTAYTGIQSQLLNWVKTDIAVYLQNISAAITNNDSDKAEKAIISRDVMHSDFSTLTSNMATLCRSTKGAKNGDIFAWSPESYIESLKEG